MGRIASLIACVALPLLACGSDGLTLRGGCGGGGNGRQGFTDASGAAHAAGVPVRLMPGATYEAIVGASGAPRTPGGETRFTVMGGAILLQLGGGGRGQDGDPDMRAAGGGGAAGASGMGSGGRGGGGAISIGCT